MNYHTSAPVITAFMLVVAAGLVAPANAQTSRNQGRDSATIAPSVDFRSSKWLSDRKVVNANDEEIANVSDLILDRGRGRIEYLVVKTGTTLGLGGRAIAIPYGAFQWQAGKDRFLLASTKEQLEQFPEFSAESWTAMKDAKKDDKSTLRTRLGAEAASPSDPYAGNLDTAGKVRVEGQIKKVDRVRISKFGEHVVITVETPGASTRRIALGPSWYVNGTAAAPMRGDKVVVDTLALPRDPDQLLAATNIRTSDRELKLRETDGTPVWGLKAVESGGQSYSTSYSRYLLTSHLPGMKVDCRGSDCGKVHQVIIDRSSGEVGFISIDPNQNFLGISDTKRLIPWSVASVTLDGNVRIDASKEMVLASPETPGELDTLNSGTHAEGVYKAFDVPAPRFEPVKPVSAALPGKDNAWSTRGLILAAIEKDSARTLEGKVIDISEVKFEKGVQPARALKIKLPGDGAGEELVLVAPAWYLDNQKPVCQNGDTVKIDACRTTIDGRRYWLARAIDCNEARVVLLDGSNVPAWVQP